MKFSLHLSNVALALITSALLGLLLLTDISMRMAQPAAAPAVSSEKVVTKELTLTDSQGRVRIRMAVDDSDAPSLQMYGQDGGKRALLRLNQNDVPSLRLYDASGSVRSVTGFTLNDMQPAFVQFDETGAGHAINNASPYLSLHPYATIYDADTVGRGMVRSDPFASLYGDPPRPEISSSPTEDFKDLYIINSTDVSRDNEK